MSLIKGMNPECGGLLACMVNNQAVLGTRVKKMFKIGIGW